MAAQALKFDDERAEPDVAEPEASHEGSHFDESKLWRHVPPEADQVTFFATSDPDEQLEFGSSFSSGNLLRVEKIGSDHFELELRFDDCCPSPKLAGDGMTGPQYPIPKVPAATAHWFYFAMRRPATGSASKRTVRFDIINMTRQHPRKWNGAALAPAMWRRSADSANDGQPQAYGWRRCTQKPTWTRTSFERAVAALDGQEVAVVPPDGLWTLSLTHSFPAVVSDEQSDDVVFLSSGLPYTKAELLNMVQWMELQSLQGSGLVVEDRHLSWRVPTAPMPDAKWQNRLTPDEIEELQAASDLIALEHESVRHCQVLTVTGKPVFDDPRNFVPTKGVDLDRPHRPLLVVMARECASESCSSWALQGLLCFLCGKSQRAAALRAGYEVVCAPMLAAEGVEHGRYHSMHEEGVEYEREWGTSAYGGPVNGEATSPADAFKRWLRKHVEDGRQVACVLEIRAAPSSRQGPVVSLLRGSPNSTRPTSPNSRETNEATSKAALYQWMRSALPTAFADHTQDVDEKWRLHTKTSRKADSSGLVLAKELKCAAFALEVPQFGAAAGPCGEGFESRKRVAYCSVRLASMGFALGLSLHSCLCVGAPPEVEGGDQEGRDRRSRGSVAEAKKTASADDPFGPWTNDPVRQGDAGAAIARAKGSEFTRSALLSANSPAQSGAAIRVSQVGQSLQSVVASGENAADATEIALTPAAAGSACSCFPSGLRGRCCSGHALPLNANTENDIAARCPWLTFPGRPAGAAKAPETKAQTDSASCSGGSRSSSVDAMAASENDSEYEVQSLRSGMDRLHVRSAGSPYIDEDDDDFMILDNTSTGPGLGSRRGSRVESPRTGDRRALRISSAHSGSQGRCASPTSKHLAPRTVFGEDDGCDSDVASDDGAKPSSINDLFASGTFRWQQLEKPAPKDQLTNAKDSVGSGSDSIASSFVLSKRGGPLCYTTSKAANEVARKLMLEGVDDLPGASLAQKANKVGAVAAPAPWGTVEFGSATLPGQGSALPVLGPLRPAKPMSKSICHASGTVVGRAGWRTQHPASSVRAASRSSLREGASLQLLQVTPPSRQRMVESSSLPELRRTPSAPASTGMPSKSRAQKAKEVSPLE